MAGPNISVICANLLIVNSHVWSKMQKDHFFVPLHKGKAWSDATPFLVKPFIYFFILTLWNSDHKEMALCPPKYKIVGYEVGRGVLSIDYFQCEISIFLLLRAA